MRSFKKGFLRTAILVAGGLIVGFCLPYMADAQVLNESFETEEVVATRDDNRPYYLYEIVPGETISGWIFLNNQAMVFNSVPGYWEAYDGKQFICLQTNVSSEAWQILYTVPGQRYRISFAVAGDFLLDSTEPDDVLGVYWEGVQIGLVDPASSFETLMWQEVSYVVTASGTTAELRFKDENIIVGHGGPLLDAVTVEALTTAQMITVTAFPPPTASYGTMFPVAATASSGLPVAITTTGACTGSGSGSATVTMTSGTGTCTVHYNQPGNVEYEPAPEVTSETVAVPDTVAMRGAFFLNIFRVLWVSATSTASPEATLYATVPNCVTNVPMEWRTDANAYALQVRLTSCGNLDGQTATVTSSHGGVATATIK